MAQVKVTFRPNRAGVNAAGRSNAVYRELERRADKVIALAQAIAPVDTGVYRASFAKERTRVRGQAAVQVTNTAPYAAVVEHGSRPHVIESTGPWPLRNAKTGQVFGRKVNHPGTPAFHVLRRALRAAGR